MYLLSSEISNKQKKRSVFTVQPVEALRGANISIPRTKFNRNYSIKLCDNSMPYRIHFNSKSVPIKMNLISFKAFGQIEVFCILYSYLVLKKKSSNILYKYFKYFRLVFPMKQNNDLLNFHKFYQIYNFFL